MHEKVVELSQNLVRKTALGPLNFSDFLVHLIVRSSWIKKQSRRALHQLPISENFIKIRLLVQNELAREDHNPKFWTRDVTGLQEWRHSFHFTSSAHSQNGNKSERGNMFVFLSAPATVISANEKEMADRLDYGSTFFRRR